MGKAPSPFERDAGDIVQRYTGARLDWNDDGSAVRMVDWHLTYPDGRRAALEVTRAIDSVRLEQAIALNRLGPTMTVAGLSHGWHVHVAPDATVKGIGDRLQPVLAAAEQLAIRELGGNMAHVQIRGRQHLWPVLLDLEAQTAALGCVGARVEQVYPPGHLVVLQASSGGWDAGAAGLAEWLVDFLPSRPDDLAKLAADHADESHLFVFIDLFAAFHLYFVLHPESTEIPTVALDLPHPLTHLWVTSASVYRRVLAQVPGLAWVEAERTSAEPPGV